MTRKFVSSFAVYGVGGAIAKFCSLLSVPVFIRFLDTEGFGALELAATLESLVFISLSLELHSGYARDYYEAKRNRTLEQRRGALVAYYLFVSALATLIWWLLVLESETFNEKRLEMASLPIVAGLFPKLFNNLALVTLRFEDRARVFFVVVVLKAFLSVGIGIFSVAWLETDYTGVLWANAIGSWIVFAVLFGVAPHLVRWKRSTEGFKSMISYSAPIVPAVLGGWFLQAIGRVALGTMVSMHVLGIYALALKVGMIMMLGVYAFNQAWTPIQNRLFSEKESEEKIALTFDAFLIFGVLVAVGITSAAPLLVVAVAQPDFHEAASLAGIVVFGNLLEGLSSILASGNAWARRTAYNSLGSILGGLTSAIVLWFWVERGGAVAAAGSLLLGNLVKVVVTLVFAQRHHHIPYENKSLFLSIVSCVIYVAISAVGAELFGLGVVGVGLLNLFAGILLVVFLISITRRSSILQMVVWLRESRR